MNSKGLHIAIKDAMKQMGDDVIVSPQFVNILSDLSAFSDYPSCKVILKDLQQSGELQKIYDAYKKNGKKCTTEIDALRKSIQNNGKYKKALVAYVYDCFLFAFGSIGSVSEPTSGAFDAMSSGQNGQPLDLYEQLNDLKQEYNDLLERLAVKPTDILHEPAAYYPAMAMNELYLVEAKIQIVSNALGKRDETWCHQQLEKKIGAFKFAKRQNCDKELARLKKEYESKLQAALVIPSKKNYISKSAYFAADALDGLSSLEDEIRRMYQEIGDNYDDWCDKMKSMILAAHGVSPKQRRNQIITKIGIPAALAAGALWLGGSYVGSKGEIDQFNNDMSRANELVAEGHFREGFLAYQEAKDGYDGSFFPGSFEGDADEAIETTVKMLCAEASELISNNQLVAAQAKLNEIPESVITSNKDLEIQVKDCQDNLKLAVANIKDSLLTNISENGGKLDSEGKKMLEEGLLAAPDDYWLNFIKSKEK